LITVELPEGYLARHERIALERGAGEFLLPVTIAEEGGRMKLMYRSEGFVALGDYGFHGDLYRVFRALKRYAAKIRDAQDMLLRPDRVFVSGDKVFVDAEDQGVRLLYGANKADGAPGKSIAYGVYTEALIPLLAELSAKAGITGVKAAMTQLAKKIKTVNPDYETAIKILESVERQWNYMQPVGP
jgi:hypothetical protein